MRGKLGCLRGLRPLGRNSAGAIRKQSNFRIDICPEMHATTKMAIAIMDISDIIEMICLHPQHKNTFLLSKGSDVPILSLAYWPSAKDLELDDSQYRALQMALTKEFAVIQGPPGTGKTYIGLKVR